MSQNSKVKTTGKHLNIWYDVLVHNCQKFVTKLTLQFFLFGSF